MKAWPATALLAVGLLGPTIAARDAPADATAAAAVRLEFLATNCFACHGPEKQRGDFRLDTTPYDLGTSTGRARWQLVLERIDKEEMPPPEAPRHPTRAERDRIVELIRTDMDAAAAQAPVGGSPLRRLKRVELQNSVRDLFGIRGIRLPSSYPEDETGLPSDTAPAGLPLSAAHMHACMELAADVAERMVYLPAQQATSRSDLVSWSKEASMWAKGGDTGALYFSGVNNAAWCGAVWDRAFIAPESGTYLVQLKAGAEGDVGADGKPLRLGFYALFPGDYYMPESANRVDLPRVGSLDVPASPVAEDLTCTVELEKGEAFHVYCDNRLPATQPQGALNRIDLSQLFIAAKASPLPTVRIEHMTITGPVGPLTRQVGFLGGRSLPSPDEAFLRSVLLPLAERAYRRPLSAVEALDVMGPVMSHLDEVESPELALRFGIRRILLAPEFQYLDTLEDGDGYALASRLSYFLWSSMPDAELLGLASTGRIAEPDVLRDQVLRMLADPKGQRFVQDFTGEWLGNRELASLMVCDDRYVWNEPLRYGYIRSSEMYFDEMLRKNHSIRTFIDSDFTYANLPMRMVWGFPGKHPPMSLLESNQSQSHIWPEPERLDLTSLPRGVPPNVVNRGGVLGLPGVLTLTGDGVESSPIRRGVWVLENLYGTPPPPPPDDVKALITDTSGATTVRETLAAHQDSASCASCHSQIDPVGLALENYDAAGNWRAIYYRGRPEPGVAFTPELVDPTGELPDGVHLDGPQDLKQHLLAHSAMFTRCLATRILEYATGRRMSVGDARVVQQIVQAEPADGYGFRDLLVTLVQSEVFRTQ